MAFICFMLVICSLNINAQVSLVQNVIDKIGSYKNFSYQSINRLKELFANDTIMKQCNSLFLKAPEDKNFGYLFKIETQNANDKLAYTDLYNGQNLLHINSENSTYEIQGDLSFNMQATLPGFLRWILSRLEKPSSRTVKMNDTTINAINSYHLIATVYDTVINKERNYTDVHLFIDELSGMPSVIIITSRNTTYGNGISNYYSESRYFDYKFNQDNVDIASMTIPKGLHSKKAQAELPKEQRALLTLGSVAPGWILYDAKDKKMTLAQLKGKVVLIDFFFIGCFGCMESLKPLNKLHEKYNNQNVAMVSLTFRDSKKSAAAFAKNYNIKYPIYINANDVVKSYNVEVFPTFYFIDKKGKIANVIVGYGGDFEKKVTSIVAKLLNE
jgi:peroxiredoxin